MPAAGWPAPATDPSIAWAAPPAAAAPRPAAAAAAPVPPPAPTLATSAGGRPRLVIERVQLVSAGLTTSVTVVLAHDGRSVQGTAEGTATTGSLHRSVAAATLRAVESVVGEGVRFDVEHVEVARTGPDRTALVVVTMVTDRATQRLSGASVVREDVRQAVIRAVLAAVNRRVEPLIAGGRSGVTVRPHWPGRLVDLPTGVLHVRETSPRASAGPDTRELAVMVHGLGGAATNWTDLMGLLEDRLHGIAPDLPGFGWSPPPQDGDYSVRAHARALAALLESVGDGRPVHLLGNSLGGTVAMVVAATRPHLVRTLTLVSPALPVLRPRLTNVHLPALAVPWAGQRLARRLGRFPVEQRVRATLALCYADPSRVPPQRVEEAMTEATRRAGLEHDGEAMLLSLRSLMCGLPAAGHLAAVAPRRARHRTHPARLRPQGPAGRPAHRDPRGEGDPRQPARRRPGQRARHPDGAPRAGRPGGAPPAGLRPGRPLGRPPGGEQEVLPLHREVAVASGRCAPPGPRAPRRARRRAQRRPRGCGRRRWSARTPP